MDNLFVLLLLVSFICLILGCYRLIREVIKKDGKYLNNKRLILCSLSAGVIALVGVGITAPEEVEISSTEKTIETTKMSTQSSSEIQASEEKRQEKLAEEKKQKEEEEKQKKLAEEKKQKEEEEKQKKLAEEKKQKEEEEKQQKLAEEKQRKEDEEKQKQVEAQQKENEQAQQVQQEDDVAEMVYVTPTGEKYHTHPHGNGDFSQTTLENAKTRGLEPCKVCY